MLLAAAGALAQPAVWLTTRPDTASGEGRLWTWIALEALLAVAIGCAARERGPAGWTVVVGWTLQVLHYAVVADHGQDEDRWGDLVWMQLLLAALAVKLAFAAHDLTARARRRARG